MVNEYWGTTNIFSIPANNRTMGEVEMKTWQSATRDKIDSMLPKGAELIHYEDDGIRLRVIYSLDGISYNTNLASTSSANSKMRNRRDR